MQVGSVNEQQKIVNKQLGFKSAVKKICRYL